jgi:hypothetical protein
MKKEMLISGLLAAAFFIATSTGLAQESAFDKEAAPWHKKAVMTCGMLRNLDTFEAQKMLGNLQELQVELEQLAAKYASNPPQEYAADPLWKTYFENLADNIVIVRERVEKKQYRLAQMYCGNFCKIFGAMHENNGRTDLTDLLFSWRGAIRSAMDVFNTGNHAGVKKHLDMATNLYNQVTVRIGKNTDSGFGPLFAPVKSAFEKWQTAVAQGNKETAREQFNIFMETFPKPYLSTL